MGEGRRNSNSSGSESEDESGVLALRRVKGEVVVACVVRFPLPYPLIHPLQQENMSLVI